MTKSEKLGCWGYGLLATAGYYLVVCPLIAVYLTGNSEGLTGLAAGMLPIVFGFPICLIAALVLLIVAAIVNKSQKAKKQDG